MRNLRVKFANEAGGFLSGILDLPAATPQAYALFAHCFSCSKNSLAARNIARAMTDAGIAVLRFDFTGLGQSEGEFADSNFSGNVSDLLAACRFLEAEYLAPAILVGHSLGGTAVLEAARAVPSAVAVATLGSPAEPAHVAALFKEASGDLIRKGEAEVRLGGRPFTVRRQFLDDLRKHDLPASVGRLKKALLIMHAPLDEVVGIDNAADLFAAARHPKSFVSLDTADHLLTRQRDSLYAGQVLAAWASRYLPVTESGPALAAGDQQVVARTFIDGFRTDITAGRHAFVADEPAAVGGTEQGPSPYDLLSAALASCTSMTLKMYAVHKQLPLRSVTVTVAHSKIHAADCAECRTETAKIDEFRRSIAIDGELSPAQTARILEIADRCPVHRTLQGEIKLRTTLAD